MQDRDLRDRIWGSICHQEGGDDILGMLTILIIPPCIPAESAGIRKFRRNPQESTGIPEFRRIPQIPAGIFGIDWNLHEFTFGNHLCMRLTSFSQLLLLYIW